MVTQGTLHYLGLSQHCSATTELASEKGKKNIDTIYEANKLTTYALRLCHHIQVGDA